MAHRIDRGPMIIDGVLMLDALAQIDRKADFLVGGWFVNFANHRQKEQSRVAYRENIDGGHSNSQFCGRFGRDPSNRARLHSHARSPIHPKAVH